MVSDFVGKWQILEKFLRLVPSDPSLLATILSCMWRKIISSSITVLLVRCKYHFGNILNTLPIRLFFFAFVKNLAKILTLLGDVGTAYKLTLNSKFSLWPAYAAYPGATNMVCWAVTLSFGLNHSPLKPILPMVWASNSFGTAFLRLSWVLWWVNGTCDKSSTFSMRLE